MLIAAVFGLRPGHYEAVGFPARFEERGVPAGPVYDVNQMHRDPQVLAREMVVEVKHARLGPVHNIGLPVKFSDTPGEVARGAPLYGQHTREVLCEHGFADDEIESLLAEGAVAETTAAASA